MRLIFSFIYWYLLKVPLKILKTSKNYIRFGFYYFSTPKLIKTFFSPWRKYKWEYGSFDFKKYLHIFASNLVSRGLGLIMRFFLIIISFIYEIFIILLSIIFLTLWFLLPFISLTSFLLGLILLM